MVILKTHADLQNRRAVDAFRQGIINNIVDELTLEDRDRLAKMIQEIIEEHVKLTHTDGFFHDGRVYTNMKGVPFKQLQKEPIHGSLKLKVIEYSKQCRELDSDKAKISQGLAVLIRNETTLQGVRDALPDELARFIRGGSGLSRTKPEMHTLTSKVHRSQYERTKDKIYFYLGSKLLG